MSSLLRVMEAVPHEAGSASGIKAVHSQGMSGSAGKTAAGASGQRGGFPGEQYTTQG